MAVLNHVPIFSSKGRNASPEQWLGVVAGMILSTTLLSISLAAPEKLPGVWIWMSCVIVFCFLSAYLIRKDRMYVEILQLQQNRFLFRARSKNSTLEFNFLNEEIRYWYKFHHIPGNGARPPRVIYYCVLWGINDEKIILREMNGVWGSEPEDWECSDDRDSDGNGVIMIDNVKGLVELITKNTSKNRA
jgi:hypothetical protein